MPVIYPYEMLLNVNDITLTLSLTVINMVLSAAYVETIRRGRYLP